MCFRDYFILSVTCETINMHKIRLRKWSSVNGLVKAVEIPIYYHTLTHSGFICYG